VLHREPLRRNEERMLRLLILVTSLIISVGIAAGSSPHRKHRFPSDSHPIRYRLGPKIFFKPRSPDWGYVDFKRKIAWQFHFKKVVWACKISVAGRGHPHIRGWKRIGAVIPNPRWRPSRELHEELRKRGHRDLPIVVQSGDPRNALGSCKWIFSGNGECEAHGNNNARAIGGYTRGCFQFGNGDIMRMSFGHAKAHIKPGDYIFVQE